MHTIVVLTDRGYWGKGQTLEAAMGTARVRRGDQVMVRAYVGDDADCHAEIEVWDDGSIRYPIGLESIRIGSFIAGKGVR